MKIKIFILTLFFLSLNLYSISNFAGIFTLLNPSSTDVTFGRDSGTANIWNTSPLGTWSNPAKLGYHNNFAFGYSRDPYLENIFDDIVITSSYLSYGWNGLGILLPTLSTKKRFGTVMSYGKQEVTDTQGNHVDTYYPYDACSRIAVGINSIEFLNNFIESDHLQKIQSYGDISIGFNIDFIHSMLGVEESGDLPRGLKEADSYSTGIGFISRFSPFNDNNLLLNYFKTDITLGIYFLNPGKTEIEYDDDTDPLPYGTRSAFSGKFSIDLSILPDLYEEMLLNLTDDLFSVYYSQDKVQYGEKEEYFNPGTWGEGIEYTFLNIFSIRKGYYIDRVSEEEGSIEGYGLNLDYKGLVQLQYNKAVFDLSYFAGEQEQTDYLLRFDFIKLYKLIKGV